MFTTALIAELLVLLIVGFSVGEHAAHPTPSGMLTLVGQIAGFVVVTWLLASRVIPPLIVLLRRLLRVPQLSFGVILGVLFLVVVGAEEIGLHGSLGALVFGAALSRLPHQIRRELVPGMRSAADGLFVPLFFSSAGLYLSTSFTALPVWTIAALVAIPAAGKFGGAALGAAVARLERPLVAATGLMAKGIAEIALLLVLRETGLIGADVFSLLVLIMLGYILLIPPIIGRAVQSAETAEPSTTVASLPPSLLRFALDNVTVSDVIDPARSHPAPSVPVRIFVEDWVVPHQQDYVVAADGELSGIVSLGMLRYLPKQSWAATPLGNVTRVNTPNTWSDEYVEDALQQMTEASLTVLPVLDRETERFLGAITSQEIVELITSEARGGE